MSTIVAHLPLCRARLRLKRLKRPPPEHRKERQRLNYIVGGPSAVSDCARVVNDTGYSPLADTAKSDAERA